MKQSTAHCSNTYTIIPETETRTFLARKMGFSALVVGIGAIFMLSYTLGSTSRAIRPQLLASERHLQRDGVSAASSLVDSLTFVGGYTVSGHSISTTVSHDGLVSSETASFTVGQECMCSCNATSEKGPVLCLGANPGNAFSAIAFEENGEWFMEQQSINGSAYNYHATFRFGEVPGGAHSATGFLIVPTSGDSTQFRAAQSAIGCSEGAGASSCVPLCRSHGIQTSQLSNKCSL